MNVSIDIANRLESTGYGSLLGKSNTYRVGQELRVHEIDNEGHQNGRILKCRVNAITDARKELKASRTVVVHLTYLNTETHPMP